MATYSFTIDRTSSWVLCEVPDFISAMTVGLIHNQRHRKLSFRIDMHLNRILDFSTVILRRSSIWTSRMRSQPYLSDESSSSPVPPLAEQRRIVAKVDQLMALVDQLETQLETSRATAAKLMDALVAELTALH